MERVKIWPSQQRAAIAAARLVTTGRKFNLTAEQRLKVSIAKKGQKYAPMSLEARKKIGDAQRGILKKKETCHREVWARRVKKRDGYVCQRCGKGPLTSRASVAHHLKPHDRFPDDRYKLSNGITVCSKICHAIEDAISIVLYDLTSEQWKALVIKRGVIAAQTGTFDFAAASGT